ncbi:MAG: CoA transferase [Deltaproteobacteria bacterium]|nr:CoA transferase [Deltaproteobacteria bacterium]
MRKGNLNSKGDERRVLTNMIGALDGIKVLDLSRYAPGPYCSMILGDLGADVITVEAVGMTPKLFAGDKVKGFVGAPVREFAPPGSPYDPLNRNKRSIGLNLKTEQGREIFYKMVENTDVVLEGFRPGVTERLGIDYISLKKRNGRIIYCAVTGYGQNGPYKDLPGHDINYISSGGAISILKAPSLPGNLLGDIASGGMQAVIGILAAVIAREKTGKGQIVDISMTDGVVSLLALYMGKYFENNGMPDEPDRVSIGTTPFYNIYRTQDGKMISIACGEAAYFANLCKVLECEEFIPNQTNPEIAEEIGNYFRKKFLTRTRDEWFDIMSQYDIAVSKVNGLDEIENDPQLKHRDMVIELDHPEKGRIKQVGVSIKLSDTPGSVRKLSPKPGENTEKILIELGYDRETIEKLGRDGIISPIG